jgi:uncharacterized protein YukE
MANEPGQFTQDTGPQLRAADVIARKAADIGVDGNTGHVGELRDLLKKLSEEWQSTASTDHQERMARWNASVVRLAELTRKISTDLRTGTDTLARAASSLGGPTSNRYVQGISGE